MIYYFALSKTKISQVWIPALSHVHEIKRLYNLRE